MAVRKANEAPSVSIKSPGLSDAYIFKINIDVDSPSQTTLMKCALMG